jgi:hypothetical protein
MARTDRPHAITSTDVHLVLVLDELEEQGETLRQVLGVLTEIRDRLPAGEPQTEEPVRVDLREPANEPANEPDSTAQPVTITEPAADPAPRRRPAKKATTAKAVKTTG